MDIKQIEMMACPECHGKLDYAKESKELICNQCKLAYPVKDGIPVMLSEESRKIDEDS